MRRIRTQIHLQDYLDAEIGWRTKEIANMKSAVKSSAFVSEGTMVRAGIALLYAHWEGFIKSAATAYIDYIANQELTYAELQSCFVVFGLKKKLNELTESRKSAASIAALDFVRDQLGQKARLNAESAIDTASNLSSAIFHNILLAIGFDPSGYEARFNLIDESLLRRRNHIAHGEYLDVRSEDWSRLADEILHMIRQFKTDIENAMSQSSFRQSVGASLNSHNSVSTARQSF